jgi:hypothetical protein
LEVVGDDAALRRLILLEQRSHVGLTDLIRAEATVQAARDRQASKPARPQAALPAPPPEPLPFLKHDQKGRSR